MDISSLNWDTYIKNYICGIRKYVLKDSDDSMPQAKRKLRRYVASFFIYRVLGEKFNELEVINYIV